MTQDVDEGRVANATPELVRHEGIEITEEMIDAGAGELCGFDSRYESMEEAVVRIFTAMVLAAGSKTLGRF